MTAIDWNEIERRAAALRASFDKALAKVDRIQADLDKSQAKLDRVRRRLDAAIRA